MAYIGKEPIVGNFQKCDAITVVNGQAAYTLQVSSTNVVPESANHMLVSLNGILQAPVTSFTVSSSTLTFASNLATGDVIDFVILLGNVLDLGTVSDGTITNAKLAQDIISGETALASAPADTDEFLVSDAGTLKRIDYSLIKGGNTPMILVRPSSGQTIATATTTKVALGTEVIDTDSTFASDKWTPGVVGKYYISGNTSINLSTAGAYLQAAIYKNGSAIALGQVQSEGTTATMIATIEVIDTADADDYYELYVRQNTGGSLDTNQSAGELYTKMMGFKIG